ncbi:MAG: hypothetical protein WC702_00095 [Patescibacteria group bacterium]|jgi:hypothetical protein
MRKNKITTGLALLGVLGMSAAAPSVYASDSASDSVSDEPSTVFLGEFGPGSGHDSKWEGKKHRGPGPGGPMTAEEIEEMSTILANNDFAAFLEKMSENAPADAPIMTDEHIAEMQTRFAHMIELYNNGELPGDPLTGVPSADGRGAHGRGPGGPPIKNQADLATVLANDDFDAYLDLLQENRPAEAPVLTDEMLQKMQNHFDRMVERYKNGEMPWQQPSAPVEAE